MRLPLALAVLALAAVSQADQVSLTNGDRLTGKVVELVKGTLTFETELAGKVKISADRIADLTTEGMAVLRLSDGQWIEAKIAGIADGALRLAGIGTRIDWSQVEAINPPMPKAAPPARWKGIVSSNFGLTRSDREAQNLDINVEAARKTPRDRWEAKGSYFNARQTDGGETQTLRDAWFTRTQYDRLVDARRFFYGNLRLDHDAVKDLDLRTLAGAGAGFTLVQNERADFSVEVGGSYLDERYEGGERRDTLGVQLGTSVRYRFNGAMTLSHDLSFVADPSKSNEYLVVSDLSFRSELNRALFSELRFVFDYDPTPRTGSRKDSYRYLMGLGYRF